MASIDIIFVHKACLNKIGTMIYDAVNMPILHIKLGSGHVNKLACNQVYT